MATNPTAVSPLDDPNLEVIPASDVPKIAATPRAAVARGIAPSREDLTRRAAELGVDPKFALSIFAQESSGNWGSKDSPKGARGGMQLMPGTFRMMMGTDQGQDDPWNNMEAGLRYLRYGQRVLKTNDPSLLAAGYHAGYDHPDLKAGKIPGTNDGMISTAAYAKSVAGKAGAAQPQANPLDALNKAEPGRYELVDFEAAGDQSQFEPLTPDEVAGFDLTTAAAMQKDVDSKPMLGYLKDKATGGYEDMTQALAMARWAVAGGDAEALADQLSKQLTEKSKAPKTTGEKEIDAAFKEVTDAKGAWDTTKKGAGAIWTAITNPKALAGEVVGQAANSLPTLGAGAAGAGTGAGVGALAGAPAGGVGAVPGAIAGAVIGGKTGLAAGTTVTELGAEVTDMISKRLADANAAPTAQNILAILSDKNFKSEALKQGLAKGLTVAAIDQVFMGLGGKIATAPVRREATKALAEQGVDVSTRQARKEALATPTGRAAIAAASPSIGARVAAGTAAVGVDAAGEVIGEAASQQVARGEIDKGDALREGVTSLGQSVAEVGAGMVFERAKQAAQAAREAIKPVENAPSTARGPLERASENAAVQPDRVTATAPDGSKVTGTVTGTSTDGKVEILDDEGNVVTISTGDAGVKIEQDAPNTPLTNALEVAVDAAPDQPVAPEPVAEQPVAEQPAEQTIEQPTEQSKPPALADMDEPALRERLKYIADQAKGNGGWNSMLIKARREVEREINARAPKAEKPAKKAKPVQTNVQPAGEVNATQADQAQQAAPQRTEATAAGADAAAAPVPAAGAASQVEPDGVAPAKAGKIGPASLGSAKADMDHLFGVDAKRAKAMERIAAGKAWFNDGVKAKDFIAKNGLKDTHEVARGKGGRFDVVAKGATVPAQNAPAQQGANDGQEKGRRNQAEVLNAQGAADQKAAPDVQPENQDVTDQRPAQRPLSRDTVKATAEDIAQRFRQAGFQADVDHSGSAAGASSYVKVRDDENGRFLTKTIRVSDHSKGAYNSQAHYNIQYADDVERTVSAAMSDANEMKAKGPSEGLLAIRERERKAQEKAVAKAAAKAARKQEPTNGNDQRPAGQPDGAKAVERQEAPAPATATVQPNAEKAAKQDAPYLSLLKLKSTTLLSNSGGRKLYAVTLSPAFRREFFEVGRGFNLPRSDAFELKEKSRVTGNQFDAGYILIDRREQAASRAMQPDAAEVRVEKVAPAAASESAANDTPTEPTPPTGGGKPDPFANNTIFTSEKVEAARARMKAKLGRLNSGFDPEMALDGLVLAGGYIESGTRKFADYAKAMVADFGDDIKPYLLSFYESVRAYPGVDSKEMTPVAQAKAEYDAMNVKPEDVAIEATAKADAKVVEVTSLDQFVATIEEGDRAHFDYAGTYGSTIWIEKEGQSWVVRQTDDERPRVTLSTGVDPRGGGYSRQQAIERAKNVASYRFNEWKPVAKAAVPDAAQQEQNNDTQGNDADYAEPLDNQLPTGNPELAQDVAPETSAGVRDPNPNGDGRAQDRGVKRRTGVGRGEKPVLHGPTAEVRPVENGPLNRDSDTPNQLPLGGFGNFQITDEDKIGEGTKGQKLRNNMAAIRTLRQVQRENRAASPAEQAAMAKFVGWGGLRELIDPNTTGKQWIEARAELLGTNGQPPLLVGGEKGEDWISLQRSTTAAHFTAPEVVKAMWSAVEHFGFSGGRALEPTSGIGNFIGLQPQNLAASTEWHGAELDTITGQMAKLIYPEAAIHAGTGFESVPFAKGAFDLAIGNPPFGSLTIKSDVPAYSHIPEMKIHNYIIAKTGEHLRPGGVMAMVVTHRFLDTANPEAREYLAKSFRFLGAFRLPNDAFKANAGTEVVTDVLFLQKLREGEKAANTNWLDTEGKITVDGVEMRVNRYYQANPGNILGRSAMDGRMYGAAAREGGQYTVHGDGRDLTKAINDIVAGEWADLKDIAKPTNADQDVAAVMLNQSDLPIGGVVLDESGKIFKREMDDEAGNAVIKEVTPETLWKDGAEQWQGIEQAARALRDGRNFEAAAKEFAEASALAYTAKGEKKPKPTKAEQAVYDIRDSLDAPSYRWDHNEQLAEIQRTLERKKLGPDSYQTLKGLLGLRAAALKLIAAEMKSAPNMEELRAALNKEYDAFVAKHGYVSDPANANLLDGDVGVESGLETGFRPKSGKTKASASKSDIFTQRVNFPYKEITSAKDANDGLQISMSERGRLDIAYIAKLTGQSKIQVINELSTGDSPAIFFDPDTNEYEDADSYLSGNVKRKLEIARSNGLKANVKALEAVQPAPKTRDNVRPNIRGSWMPKSVFEQFLTDIGVQNARVNIIASQGMILAQQSSVRENEFGAQFKSGIRGVTDIFNAASSGKPITIWVETADGKRVKNETVTKEVNLLVERMAKVFEEWAYANDGRVNAIVDAFNEKMNTHIPRKFDGNKYLKTVGANPSIVLRTTQKNAAWRMVQADTVLLDHVVGAGKTFTIITGVKERKRLGLSRKPLIVVPNHLVTQWAKDFYALYPASKILAATPDDFAAKKRKRMFSRIATGDYDAVIIGHSSMGFIPAPMDDQQRIINENITELQDALNEMKAKKESGRSLTQIQERLQKYKGKLKELMDAKKDDIGLDLESMGIDYIAVDEHHEFKNLEYSSAGERVVGMNDPKGSKKAFDLYIKLRGVLARGGAITGATGTPVSNSLVELYTMMKYFAHKDLTERNQANFDAWSGAYTRTENRLEYTATQKLKPRRVLAGLNNLSSLKQLYESFADVISMDDLKRIYSDDVKAKNKKLGTNERTEFPVPKVAGGRRQLDTGPITQAQSLYMDYLVARMKAIEQNKSNKEYAKLDNPLYVLTDARKMSLDIRIVDPTAPRDENGKVVRAAQRIKAIYDKWDADKGTQMVFCDLSTPAKNAVKEAKALIRDSLEKVVGANEARRIKGRVESMGTYINQWRYIESLAGDIIDNPQTDQEVADKIAAYMAGLEDVDATMTTADVGFSVYDDMRQVLIDSGIPEREIAFIHDYNTPEQKAKLFQAVNDGEIRVLMGSSAKMGAGTNAQKRLVGLHHMDAPWRPSDVEQREGRIIRQGNMLYQRDPEGFEVSITAYSTNGTSDAVMWQVLERKSKAIEEFRSSEMDSTDEDEGDANQYAEFMAQSTGNPVFKLKLEAEREVDLLDAETRGVVLAKSQAKQFMENYDRDVANAKALIDMAANADVDSVTVGKESGTAKEFNDVMAAADAKYTEDYAKYLEKKEEANQALDAWNAQLEMERGDKPKMPTAPAKPGPMSKQVMESSGYARAIKAALEKGSVLGNFEFQIGNVKLRVRKSPVSETFWLLDIYSGRDWQGLESADAQAAENSSKLAMALTPDAIMQKVKAIGKSGEWTKNNLESQREAKEKLATRDIGTAKLETAKKSADWYRAQVSFAEQQADEIRGRRVNQYISGDRKRPLEQFKSEPKEPKPVEFEGSTYNLTGYTSGNQAQAIDESGNEVLVVMNKDGQPEKVITKPAGVEFSGIKKVDDAAFAEKDQTDTPEFKRWFGDSKVVDAEGKPLVVYHGTDEEITVFEPYWKQLERDATPADLRSGSIAQIYKIAKAEPELHFFAKDRGHAESYGPNVVEAYLKIENMVGSPEIGRDEAIKLMLDQDADGAQFYDSDANGGYGGVSYVVRRSTYIKSATGNRGTFDLANPDIRFSEKYAAPAFFSALSAEVGALNIKAAQPQDWVREVNALVKKGKVKADEVEWTGLSDWLGLQTGKVTKQQVQDYLDANGVQVEEVVLGGEGNAKAVSEWLDGADASVRYEDGNYVASYGGSDIREAFDTEDEAWAALREEAQSQIGDYQPESAQNTKYGNYTLPGGENYREVLLTLPAKQFDPAELKKAQEELRKHEAAYNPRTDYSDPDGPQTPWALKDKELRAKVAQLEKGTAAQAKASGAAGRRDEYKSSHWDQPNVLAHIRVNDRIDADGKRVLFVEEIQSDWGQEGKKRGWFSKAVQESSAMVREGLARGERPTAEQQPVVDGLLAVRIAPFVTATDKWLTLALKRVITMAAQGGYDRVAFVTGEQSAERYDLSKQVEQLAYQKNDDGTYKLSAKTDARGSQMLGEAIPADKLEDYVGKDVAQRIVDGTGVKERWLDGFGKRTEWSVMSGLDLKVGGEGMKAFYDQIVPSSLKKLLPKVGGEKLVGVQIGRTHLGENMPQPGFDITPEMREKVAGGLPLFSKKSLSDASDAGATSLPSLTDAQSKKDIDLLTAKLDGSKGLPALKDKPFRAVQLPDAADLGAIGSAFGVRVVGFDLTPDAPQAYDYFNGVTFKSTSKAVFLGAKSTRPHLALLGHETAHQLRAQRPDLYNKLVDSVSRYVDEAKYERDFVRSAVAANVKTAEGKQEEFIGEVLSDAFMDRSFWRTLYRESPKAFKNVYSIVLRLLQKLVGTPYAKKSAPYLTDYDRVMQIAAEVLAEMDGKPAPKDAGLFGTTFSENDAAFAEKEPLEGLTPPEQGLLRRVQATIQDNNNRVRQVQDRIEKMIGRKLPEYADYYGAETDRPGRIAARMEDGKNTLIQPLMEKLAKAGKTAEQLDELLHAQHAEERNIKVAEINPDYPDGGSGMTTAEANAILSKYKDDKALQDLAIQARRIAKETLDMKLAYGLIDKDAYEALTNAYDAYVPLKGTGEYGPKIKKAMGHDARKEHILENLARDYDLAIVAGERNLARHSLLQMVLTNPDADLWTVGAPPKGRYIAGQTYDVVKNGEKVASFESVAQAQAWVDGRTDNPATYIIQTDRQKFVVERDGVPVQEFYSYSKAENYIAGVKEPKGKLKIRDAGEKVREFVKPLQDNEVMVYVEGRPIRIQIKDETLAKQLRPLDQGKMHTILEFMRGFNRYLSKIYTGYSPAFIMVNLLRDVMTGTVNILGNEGIGVTVNAWKNYPAAFSAMTQWAATKKTPAGETGKYLDEYRSHGGKTGASWMADLEEQGKSLQRMYDDAYGASGYLADGKVGKATLIAGRKTLLGMAHVIEIMNQATENSLRLALFIAMRKKGVSPGMAAQAAKNVTVNFDRKGTMTPALGAIYLFFNPAVQGTANAIKTLIKGKHKGQAWTALAMLAALGFYAASQGMDEDKDRWLGEGWENRSKKLVLHIGGYTVSVPVSLEFAPFYAMGVAMAEASRGESTMATAGRVVSSFIGAYFPLGGVYSSDSDNHGADAMQAAIPTILKPGYQSATNRNSFGSQIVPESEFTKDRADNLKMFRATKNSAYDSAAQGIAWLGTDMVPAMAEKLGASPETVKAVRDAATVGRYENDITKVSPETLKHYWRTYTGGLGAFITDTIGVAGMTAADPAQVESGDIPIIKSFVKQQDVKPIRGRFYDLAKEAKAASVEFAQARKAGDAEALDKIMNSPEKVELLGLDRMISATARAAAKLRDQEVEINADKSLTPSQKRAALKELEQAEEELYRAAIASFK